MPTVIVVVARMSSPVWIENWSILMDHHDYAIGFGNAVSSLSAWMLCGINSDGEQVQLPAESGTQGLAFEPVCWGRS